VLAGYRDANRRYSYSLPEMAADEVLMRQSRIELIMSRDNGGECLFVKQFGSDE